MIHQAYLSSMIETHVHYGLQYIAAVGRNFLPAQADDSHTVAFWDGDRAVFYSRDLPNGGRLELSLRDFSIIWTGTIDRRLELSGRTHGEVIIWLHHVAIIRGYEEFEFDIPYYLGKGWASPLREFPGLDDKEVERMVVQRNAAQQWCTQLIEEHGDGQEIRTWPHHFDTAILMEMGESGMTIGAGLALPDEHCKEHYYYLSAYRGEESVLVSSLPSLANGSWHSAEGLEGAILPFGQSDEQTAIEFAREAIARLSSI